FQLKNSNILVDKDRIALVLPPSKPETNFEGVTDPNKPIELVVQNDNSLVLDGEWKVEIDFKNFMVSILGGNIINNTANDVKKFKIDVYLTNEKISSISQNFDGLQIASVPFEQVIPGNSKAIDTSIKTNLRAIPSARPH